MVFLFLGMLFILAGLVLDQPRTGASAVGLGFIIAYAILTYIK